VDVELAGTKHGHDLIRIEDTHDSRRLQAAHWTYSQSMSNNPDFNLCPVGPGVAPKSDQLIYPGEMTDWNPLSSAFPVSFVKDKDDST